MTKTIQTQMHIKEPPSNFKPALWTTNDLDIQPPTNTNTSNRKSILRFTTRKPLSVRWRKRYDSYKQIDRAWGE